MNICNLCNKQFKTKYTLKTHLQTSKSCTQISKKEKYNCEYCSFFAYRKPELNKHLKKCKDKVYSELNDIKNLNLKKDIEINILKAQITALTDQNNKLQDDIKFLAEAAIKKPTNTTIKTTNNNCNSYINLKPINEDFIKDQAKYLTIDHIKKGALGYSSYFLEYPLKDSIICTDFSRKKIKYKDENGNIVIDPEMTTLSSLLFQSIKDKNKELTVQYVDEINKKIGNEKSDSSIEYLMDIASKFSEQDLEVFRMFNGEKNGIFHDIVRNICCKTLEK